MSVIKEFKEFISRGNVVDMAVGLVIGSAFTGIVNSLVKDVLTPLISIITGKFDISKLAWVINENLSIGYGAFIQNIINFFITAVGVFIMIKIINTLRKRMEAMAKKKEEEAKEEAPPEPSKEELLLAEIRDLLKEKK